MRLIPTLKGGVFENKMSSNFTNLDIYPTNRETIPGLVRPHCYDTEIPEMERQCPLPGKEWEYIRLIRDMKKNRIDFAVMEMLENPELRTKIMYDFKLLMDLYKKASDYVSNASVALNLRKDSIDEVHRLKREGKVGRNGAVFPEEFIWPLTREVFLGRDIKKFNELYEIIEAPVKELSSILTGGPDNAPNRFNETFVNSRGNFLPKSIIAFDGFITRFEREFPEYTKIDPKESKELSKLMSDPKYEKRCALLLELKARGRYPPSSK